MSPHSIVRAATAADLPAITKLHDVTFGPGAYARTAYRIREGMPPVSEFCRVSYLDGELVASVRMTPVTIGGVPGSLLLGPLAVAAAWAGQGYGKALVALVVDDAKAAGRALILLVGNMSYYGRFGFAPVPPGQIALPGPADPARILAVETKPGALALAAGVVAGDRKKA